MKSTLNIILYFLFIFSSLQVYCQDSLSSKKLCKDVKYAFSFIRKTHINPYAYADKKTVDSTEQILLQKLKEKTKWSLVDFNIMMNLKIPALFDSHTSVGDNLFYFTWISQSDSSLFFPWEMNIEENNLYLINNEQKLKIQSINKHVVEDIFKRLQQGFPADNSLYVKNERIALFFPLYYFLLYPEDEIFELEATDTTGKIINISSKGKTQQETITNLNAKLRNSPRYEQEYQLDFYPNDIALLTVNRFYYDSEEEYCTFLTESFKTIAERQCKYLFIDISRNPGGSDGNANLLLDYLFKEDYKIFGGVYEKRISKHYIKQFKEQHYSLEGLKSAYSKRSNNAKHVIFYHFYERINDALYPFTGEVFLIQGSLTGSASMTMSSAIKTSRRGILIGNPTGDMANFYAELMENELPHSKLPLTCAASHTVFSSGSSHDQWIEPDIYLDLDKTELNEQTLNSLIEQCQRDYPHFFKYVPHAK